MNKLQDDVSKVLNEMVKENYIFHNYRFPNKKFSNNVLGDNLVVFNNGTILIIECKMTIKDKFVVPNVMNETQVETNKFFNNLVKQNKTKNRHMYLFGFYHKNKEKSSVNEYFFIDDITNLKHSKSSIISRDDLISAQRHSIEASTFDEFANKFKVFILSFDVDDKNE